LGGVALDPPNLTRSQASFGLPSGRLLKNGVQSSTFHQLDVFSVATSFEWNASVIGPELNARMGKCFGSARNGYDLEQIRAWQPRTRTQHGRRRR
jgi:hypothetical protein